MRKPALYKRIISYSFVLYLYMTSISLQRGANYSYHIKNQRTLRMLQSIASTFGMCLYIVNPIDVDW